MPEEIGKHKKAGSGWNLDYTQKVKGGPTALGFNQSFFIAGSLDMAPYVYLRNDKAVTVPTHVKALNLAGAGASDFEASECLKDFARESVAYINE
ncbi:hypothetical protein [Rubritalea profundi]|uniref:hypothetical protein n=1 Tax=Rubritalea profundi TaxID=1658618 RepID=UPI000CF55CE0|nr:hypothetical protein [Rubritalea profundi]